MIDPDNTWHVLPDNDIQVHTKSMRFPTLGDPVCECPCNPKYIVEGTAMIVVHDAFDGRLGVEWANEILNDTP